MKIKRLFFSWANDSHGFAGISEAGNRNRRFNQLQTLMDGVQIHELIFDAYLAIMHGHNYSQKWFTKYTRLFLLPIQIQIYVNVVFKLNTYYIVLNTTKQKSS